MGRGFRDGLWLFPLVAAASASAQVSFRQAVQVATGSAGLTLEATSIAAGDLNGDNDLDLVVTLSNLDLEEDNLAILENNGLGAFSAAVLTVGERPFSAAIADLDGDGANDLAIALLANDAVAVLLGNGDLTFAAATAFPVGDAPRHIAVGDIDGLNGLDLVTCNEPADTISVLLNNGDGTYAPSIDVSVRAMTGNLRSEPNGSAISDFNNDDIADIAVALAARDQVGVLLGIGDGTFETMRLFDVGSDPHAVAAADLNADGDIDLVVANTTADTISVLLGNGDGTFAEQEVISAGNNPEDIKLADMDGDGELDAVTANREGDNVSILLGTGNGGFEFPTRFSTGGAPVSVAIGDFNSDGDLDFATANQEADRTQRDDVSVVLAGESIIDMIPDIDCGAGGCGATGLAQFGLMMLCMGGLKRSWPRA